MSSFANRYNKSGNYDFKASKNAEYYKLKQLFYDGGTSKIYPVKALYINTKSRFGDSPVVAIATDMLVNLPMHLTDTVREMQKDDELTKAINNNQFGFSIYEYEGKNGYGLSVEWQDIQ